MAKTCFPQWAEPINLDTSSLSGFDCTCGWTDRPWKIYYCSVAVCPLVPFVGRIFWLAYFCHNSGLSRFIVPTCSRYYLFVMSSLWRNEGNLYLRTIGTMCLCVRGLIHLIDPQGFILLGCKQWLGTNPPPVFHVWMQLCFPPSHAVVTFFFTWW